MQATITSKGQLTIPKAIRERLNLHAGDRVEFYVDENGHVEIVPITASVTALKNILPPPPKAATLEEMEDAIRKGASRS